MQNGQFYRGKRRKQHPVLSYIIIALVVILALAIFIFCALKKYIVYTQDGISVEFPILKEESTPGDLTEADITDDNLVVGEADYSDVSTNAGSDLEAIKAIYIPYSNVTVDYVASRVESMTEANTVILQLKPANGQLVWNSTVSLASSYNLNGTVDIEEVINSAKEAKEDVYLVADLSALIDTMMVSRNYPQSLQTVDGSSYSDGNGSWINPYSSDMRNYLADLANELIGYGFDEILFSNVVAPEVSDDTLNYGQSNNSSEAAITSFSLYMYRTLQSTGAKISVVGTRTALSGSDNNLNGQDIETLCKIYDRIYCYTDTDSYEIYSDNVASYITVGDVDTRFVPMVSSSGDIPESESWALY